MPGSSTGRAKGSKKPDKRPARARYWNSGNIKRRKIRNMVKFCKMSIEAATAEWSKNRKRHYVGYKSSVTI